MERVGPNQLPQHRVEGPFIQAFSRGYPAFSIPLLNQEHGTSLGSYVYILLFKSVTYILLLNFVTTIEG